MKRFTFVSVIISIALTSFTSCVCDGTEKSFREIDRKYADSKWTAAAYYTPIIGPIFIGIPMIWIKTFDYQKVLLKKPETDTYERIRWDQQLNFIYYPKSEWK